MNFRNLLGVWTNHDTVLRFNASEMVSLTGVEIGGHLDMVGAWVRRLDAQNAQISGSMLLRAFHGSGSTVSFKADGEIFILGARIRVDLDLSGAKLNSALVAENIEVGGSIWLTSWEGQEFATSGLINLSGTRVRNGLFAKAVRTRSTSPVTIDLSHAAVELLDDENGTAWGDDVLMKLEGFHYARLAISHAAGPGRGFQKATAKGDTPSASTQRLNWLRLQYPMPDRQPDISAYSPDVYDRLAHAFRTTGHFSDARAVIRERLRIERRVAASPSSQFFLEMYALFFDSGLSPACAIGTFLGCILIGWGATKVADDGFPQLGIPPVLVLETSTVNALVVPDSGVSKFKPSLALSTQQTDLIGEFRCGEAIEPLLYALDIFVPALEIHQESRCGITTDRVGYPWRIARALYSVLGWIVSALTVLTVSGVARRHLET